MSSSEASLKSRYIFKLIANLVNGLVNIVVVSIVPSALGASNYGIFTYLQQFYNQVFGFLDAGSSIAFFTKLSARRERKDLIKFYFIWSLFLLLFVLFVAFFVDKTFLYEKFLPEIPKEFFYIGLVFSFLFWFSQIIFKISDAFALTTSIESIKIFQRILALITIITITQLFTFNLKTFYFYNLFILLVFLILSFIVFYRKGIISFSLFYIKVSYKRLFFEFIDYISPLFTFNLLAFLLGVFDIWLLQKFYGSEQTGFFGLAHQISAMCFLFTSAMTPVITREFSKSFAEKDFSTMGRLFNRYIPMLYSISAYFGIFICFQAENLIRIFTKTGFVGASAVVAAMGFYPIHQTYGQLSGSVFFATGNTRLFKNIGLASLAIGILFSIIFLIILPFGALGLAIKTILTQIVGSNIQLYYNCKQLNISRTFFVKHQILSTLFFLFCAFSASFGFFGKPIFDFITSGIIYTLLVGIFSFFWFAGIFSCSKNELIELFAGGIKLARKYFVKNNAEKQDN